MNQPQLRNRLSRRHFLQLTGAGAAASLLLTACPTPAAVPAASEGAAVGSAPAAAGAELSVMAFGEADQKAFAALADAYMAEHALPAHPLVELGYPSIGCSPCTTKVAPGEDPRSGRWKGWDKVECGIHNAVTPIGDGSDDPIF